MTGDNMTVTAKIYLVGAGPGDPDLLTVKALRLLQQADVVVYDRLVSSEILQLIPAGAKQVYVGKVSGKHHMDQDAINELLLKLACTGRKVIRLKGGDPFTFGRGSEEARFLVRHGVDYEVVPGITAAAACGAYAGIPLTHRGVARSVQLIAGHCQADEPLDLDWRGLASTENTLVFYMALANVGKIRNELISSGLSAETPAAIIEKGTLQSQRTLITTLKDLPQTVISERVCAPAMLIIGRVVDFATELAWFNTSADEQYEGQYSIDESIQVGS
jgi:uroporphyrin-III C-methyltransferase/precorrin-2 dehydrogenase/sirohydrochlorin ferrochelatase/uroporphyrin-III C-methyltransferase